MEKDKEDKKIMLGMFNEKDREIYSETLIEYGTKPRNCGTIDNPDGYAKITGVCGDTVEMFLGMQDEKVAESKFITDGCMFSTAACSIAAEMAQGKAVTECSGITQGAILERLVNMPADHEHCALLAAMTVQAALQQCVESREKDK
jgi:nitrogen fixation protein NifU and related proteins